jgi:protein-L-isoaspartate O-methyltransferase
MTTDFDATFDCSDDKLRLRASARLDSETYARVKAAGFGWAPKQDLFFAVWSPAREDLLVELAGDIDEESTSLEERAAARASRFSDYRGKRAAEAHQARAAVSARADGIPFGQPILIGHHSQRRAERDAAKIENGMRRTVKLWETSTYWAARAAGTLAHAERNERPDVRARRIKKLEADRRSHERDLKASASFLALWQRLDQDGSISKTSGEASTFQERAAHIANLDRSMRGLWSEIESGRMIAADAQARYSENHARIIDESNRWIAHIDHRLTYERALLAGSGYTPPPKKPTKAALPILNYGGRVKTRDHRRNAEDDVEVELVGITKAEWAKIHADYKGTCVSADGTHRLRTAMLHRPGARYGLSVVYLTDSKQHPRPGAEVVKAKAAEIEAARQVLLTRKTEEARARVEASKAYAPEREKAAQEAAPFEAVKQALKAGVQVVAAPQLFSTPPALAARMVELAGIEPGDHVLEPSAGTGNILRALRGLVAEMPLAIEIDVRLADALRLQGNADVIACDFLQLEEPEDASTKFRRVLMNPPFGKGQDCQHIRHALKFLKPGGRLVAICADGPRQQAELRPLATTWEELPDGTFRDQGTNVRTVLLTVQG